MKYGWRERISGAVILVALGAIFLPMLFDDPAPREQEPEPVMVIEQPIEGGETRQRIIESPQPPASVASGENRAQEAVPEPDTRAQLGGGSEDTFAGNAAPEDGEQGGADEAASDNDGDTGSQSAPATARDEPRADPIAELAQSSAERNAETDASSSTAAPQRTPASSGGGWVVQVGSFGQADNASRLTQQLKDEGFSAYSQPRDNNLTTVYVGPFDSSDAGEQARSELKQAVNIQGLLIRNPGN
ncbi:SPOR domain-containing protein [Salinicola avicenniae]|uniref:SPOR domain-containing protein n=1 Tax=Salinicola avicenniae TaxID=2916836 RepID=UPI0020736D72|nr:MULTISPECIES: SPOR domain-containing protein [unclassified Salinicola]